jgi:deoxyadenosine/deoxycytidine kinase
VFKQKYFVAIAGNIGTGKTTLSTMLAERFGWHAHCEAVVNNPYLADFYSDMKRWSFPLQVYFLNSRVRAHQLITYDKHSAIQDRSVYEDAHIFARNLFESGDMERRDYENYLELYQLIADQLNAPDLIIYLRKSLPKLKEQITKRGRDYEQKIPDQYLLNLNRYYEEWLTKYDLGQKLIIESDHLDYVANPEHFDWICDQIVANLPKTDQLALPTLDREPVRVL